MFKKLGILFAVAVVAVSMAVGVKSISAQGYNDWVQLPVNLYYGQSWSVNSAFGANYTLTCEQAFCAAGEVAYVNSSGYVYGNYYSSYLYAAPVYAAPTTNVCSNGFVSTWYGCQALSGYGQQPYVTSFHEGDRCDNSNYFHVWHNYQTDWHGNHCW